MTTAPLSMRKARRVDGIFLSDFEQGEIGPDLFRHACLMGLEGLVSKHDRRCHRALGAGALRGRLGRPGRRRRPGACGAGDRRGHRGPERDAQHARADARPVRGAGREWSPCAPQGRLADRPLGKSYRSWS